MKILLPVAIFLFIGLACSRPPVRPYSQYNVSGMLNDSIWFATGQAVEQTDPLPKPCDAHRFNLFIRTDLPYPGYLSQGFAQASVTGCTGECRASQWLTIFNIPVKRGKYRIASLDSCGMPFNYHYALLSYAGGLIAPFHLDNPKLGWVWVKHFDPESSVVQGRFKGDFADTTGLIVRFKRGSFKVVVQKRRKVVSE